MATVLTESVTSRANIATKPLARENNPTSVRVCSLASNNSGAPAVTVSMIEVEVKLVPNDRTRLTSRRPGNSGKPRGRNAIDTAAFVAMLASVPKARLMGPQPRHASPIETPAPTTVAEKRMVANASKRSVRISQA